MFAEERRSKILEILQKEKRVTVDCLSSGFGVSEVTVRRDLKELEKAGLLSRTHGGAVLIDHRKFEPSVMEKVEQFSHEKEIIGRLAAQLISDGETILIDAGTTTIQIIKELKDKKDLTIVTNGFNVVTEVLKYGYPFEVVVIGGMVKKRTLAMIGPLAEAALSKIRVDKVFLGANGVTLEDGVTTPDLVEANVKRKMLEIGQRKILLADHSKFNRVFFSKIADIEEIDLLITDQIVLDEKEEFAQMGVEIIHS